MTGDPNGIQVIGGSRLRRTLRKAGADMSEFRTLNLRVGDLILATAKGHTPIGPAAGGHIATTGRATASQSHAYIKFGGAAKPYGPAVHWGWYRHHIKPRLWLVDAAHQTEPRWTSLYWDGLNQIISKIEGA